jgi:hypothetical protein
MLLSLMLLDLPSGLLLSGFLVEVLYAFLIPVSHTTYPIHLTSFGFILVITFSSKYKL